jgi:hypothetical protein
MGTLWRVDTRARIAVSPFFNHVAGLICTARRIRDAVGQIEKMNNVDLQYYRMIRLTLP